MIVCGTGWRRGRSVREGDIDTHSNEHETTRLCI